MIDKTHGPGQSYPVTQKPIFQQSKPDKKTDPGTITRDTYHASTQKTNQYVIIPPKELAEKGKSGIYKVVERDLKKHKVSIDQHLPLIGGYTANIDEKTRQKLIEAGYYVFVDEEKNWLPRKPWEKPPTDDVSGVEKAPDKAEESTALKERAKLTRPRFDTPLTRKYTGKNSTIAIIDTGIYPHPDFIQPENRILEFVDFVNGKKVPYDDNGHGTHVAGDAAGSGKMSNGLYKGPAPDAKIVALKALAGKGGGKTSDIIKAITWCIQNKDKYNIRVINMSLGHTAQADYQNDPVNQAVKKAYESGIVVVSAAGNEGPDPKTIACPGDSPYAITVGAVDDMNTPDPGDDIITDFSSRGPTAGGLTKPDLVAPGEAIISTMVPGSDSEKNARRYTNIKETMKWMYKMPDEALMRIPRQSLKLIGLADSTIQRWQSSPEQARKEIKRIFNATQSLPMEKEAYVGMPGTSMAAPIVAGVVAQMLEANPDLTPGQVSQILKMTANKLPGDLPPSIQGMGMVDPHEAIQKALDVKNGKLCLIPPKIKWHEEKSEPEKKIKKV